MFHVKHSRLLSNEDVTRSSRCVYKANTASIIHERPRMTKDRPWLFRTYAGHSTARESNALYRKNLQKGQTGLSIAFDLPTQTAYDADHTLARGEVGKVGVPIGHLGDMQTLLEGIPLDRMNTSMTINAPAAWLLALYIGVADRHNVARAGLKGTTQNDILKEYLARGTYIFPPAASMRLTTDVITYCYAELPQWNPVNVCSYHLQEAGATPVQEITFALANAMAILDGVRACNAVSAPDFPKLVGRISFFVNAGIRFVEEMCKMRAFVDLWDEVCRERYGVKEEKYRRFRYGVQVNSLGLTEQQPENNVYRILLEMLAVTLSKKARARAVQLPAWNEALGLPRPWDQQWSLRLQQIVALETDLLAYDDLFEGSRVVEEKVEALKREVRDGLEIIETMGGAVVAVESSYMKQQLVAANAARLAAIESGEQVVVGVNRYQESEPSPLTQAADDGGIVTVGEFIEAEQIAALLRWREQRDDGAVQAALEALRTAACEDRNIMPASIDAAKAGVTTGEWGALMREVFGEYRAPTGVSGAGAPPRGQSDAMDDQAIYRVRDKVAALRRAQGAPIRLLVGKPGLDGHSNGAEQIAVRARDCGLDVIYDGIRLSVADIVKTAAEEDVHAIGLSILSGSHMALAEDVLAGLREAGLADVPVYLGGIIPASDHQDLRKLGIAGVFTPKDFDLSAIIENIVDDLAG